MSDLGLTHVAPPVKELERSLAFYLEYAGMAVVHERRDPRERGPATARARS